MKTFWLREPEGVMSYLGVAYPKRFMKDTNRIEEEIVRVDLYNGALLLFDHAVEGTCFAAKPFAISVPLNRQVTDMVELHAEDWGP